MAELKPCPFCGGKAELIEDRECWGHGEYASLARVKCTECYAEGKPFYDRDFPNNEVMRIRACEAWNRRAEDGK